MSLAADLGDYDEISVALFVRERAEPAGPPILGTLRNFASGRLATYIHHLPVNQSFTSSLTIHVHDVKGNIFILWIGLGYPHL